MSGYIDTIIFIAITVDLSIINCYKVNVGYVNNRNVNKRMYLPSDFYVRNENDLKELCPRFKEDNRLITEMMVDVWQTVYYTATDKVPCFKMLIRRVGVEERKSYKERYGFLGNDIFWDNCTLEIKAQGNKVVIRKHFLQETSSHQGILRNIIIEIGNTTNLIRERPDQWFVQKKLLIMKDCYTGDFVVFSRVPYQPSRDLIEVAIEALGSTENGRWTCDKSLNPR